jgi:hypothetical protein
MTEREACTDAASGTVPLELAWVFIEASKIFIFIYLFDQASKKFKNKRCMDKGHKSTDSIL